MIAPSIVARHIAIGREWSRVSDAVDAKILADFREGRPVATFSSRDEDLIDAIAARYAAIGWSVSKEWSGKDRAHEAYDRWTLTFHVDDKLVEKHQLEINTEDK